MKVLQSLEESLRAELGIQGTWVLIQALKYPLGRITPPGGISKVLLERQVSKVQESSGGGSCGYSGRPCSGWSNIAGSCKCILS